jgi:hypothetical protein
MESYVEKVMEAVHFQKSISFVNRYSVGETESPEPNSSGQHVEASFDLAFQIHRVEHVALCHGHLIHSHLELMEAKE